MPPSPLPEGTLTFLFTDVVGSSARWDRSRQALRAALERHDALLRTAIEARGGVFETIGNALCAAFVRAGGAVAAAVDARQAIGAESWARFGGDLEPLAMRAALHTGESEARGGDYFGPALSRVARLTADADAGQILISLVTQQLVRDPLPANTGLRHLGEGRPRDLVHTEHGFDLRYVDAASTASAGAPGVVAERAPGVPDGCVRATRRRSRRLALLPVARPGAVGRRAELVAAARPAA